MAVSSSLCLETILQVKSQLRVTLQDLLPSRSLLETGYPPRDLPTAQHLIRMPHEIFFSGGGKAVHYGEEFPK